MPMEMSMMITYKIKEVKLGRKIITKNSKNNNKSLAYVVMMSDHLARSVHRLGRTAKKEVKAVER